VKCQEPGRGGIWRRRDKRFSPSINLKTYSADSLNGTGISFSMVTRDGRRLEKERERTDPGKSDAEAGKVVNFATSLRCASCMWQREKPPPCPHSPCNKLCPATTRCPFCEQRTDGRGGNPLLCPSPPRSKEKCPLNVGN